MKLLGLLTVRDLGKVQKAAWPARSSWFNIGLELNIDPADLETISGDRDKTDDRFRVMLTTWLKRAQPKATLKALAEALQSPTVDCAHLAEQVLSLK